MGGLGSGFNSYRKLTTSEVLALDLQYMNIKRTVNFSGTISWKQGSNIAISKPNEYELILKYSATANGSKSNYNYGVELDYTACNYGGERIWFICPKCGQRVRILYLKNNLFRCRSCQDLNYSLQQEDKRDYAIRTIEHRMFRVQDRLKTEKDINNIYCIPKPKGMHYETYDRLMKQLSDLYIKRDDTFLYVLGSFKTGALKGVF